MRWIAQAAQPSSRPRRQLAVFGLIAGAEEVSRLGEVKLVPGMPVEAFIQTGDRTMLSYLTRPLNDQLMRRLRERRLERCICPRNKMRWRGFRTAWVCLLRMDHALRERH